MVTTTDLTAIVASATGVNPQSIVQIIRNLRSAGLLSSGGRGRHAAKMSAKDAALVIVAMLISDRPTDAAQAVKDSRHLVWVAWREATKPEPSIFVFPDGDRGENGAAGLPLQLIDALVHVLKKLAAWKPGAGRSTVKICFDTEDLSCQIVTSAGEQRYFVTEQWAERITALNAKGEEDLKIWKALRKSYQLSRISVRRTIHHNTLFEIAQLFAEART